MAREVKELMVKELEERFRGIKEAGCVLVNYSGVKADEARRLRREIGQKGSRMTVVKNSLFALAMDRLGAGELRALLDGPIAVVQGESSVDAAKAAKEMTRICGAIQVRGGYLDGNVVGPEDVERLARIPSREELLSMVAGALLAPLRRLAYGLLAKPRAVLYGLDQLRKRAEEQAGA